MDLTGIDGDHVARFRLDGSAAAQRRLRARMDQADAELLVRMARETVVRRRFHHVDAGDAARQHPEMPFRHARFAVSVLPCASMVV